MSGTKILILPGLDGTDLMLGPFRELCAASQETIVGTLPDDPTLGYEGLAEHFSTIVNGLSSCHIIAESFSGPIAILLAHKYPEVVTRLTLVASFATTPLPKFASFVPWFLLLRIPLPTFAARYFLVGNCNSIVPTLRSAIGQNSFPVLRNRLWLSQYVDVTKQYSELNCQLTYRRPTRDRRVPMRCVDEILEANPATEIREVEGPHLILETEPENSWGKIRV